MTSVPNHQPLLSGSKLLSFALVILLFVSCDPTKKTRKTNYPNGPRPESGQHPKPKDKDVVSLPTPKKDTTVIPPTQTLPEANFPENRTVKVALILPFLTNKFSESATTIQPKSDIAIQFYAGLKLALDDASYQNIPIDFTILDSKASYSETLNLQSNPAVLNADIIVGPYRKRNTALMAEFAAKKGQIMFSPFSVIQPTALSGNGTVIQTFTGLDAYMQAIVQHVLKSGDIANTIIIKRNDGSDSRAVKSIQDAYKLASGGQVLDPIKEISTDPTDLAFEELDLKEILAIKPNTVFIVPVWKDANYITSIVRKIFVSRDLEESPTIIGMPQWISFKNIDYQKLNDLHTIIPTADVITQTDETKAFAKRYHQAYSTFPGKNAYKGFDFGRYLVQFVKANRQGAFSVPDANALFINYQFSEAYKQPTDDMNNRPVLFKNNYIQMMTLEQYHLIKTP